MGESDIDLAIETSRRLEGLLESRYGAAGRGLHEKLAAVEPMLSPEALRSGRYVATMRNKVVHEDGFSLPDRSRFISCAAAFEKEIGGRGPKAGLHFPWGVLICAAGFALVVGWPILAPMKHYGLRVAAIVAAVAFLMIAAPPILWTRARFTGLRRRAPMLHLLLIILVVGVFFYAAYILSKLAR